MALFNLVFAKKHGGKFILRIEDTDQSRCRDDYERNIFEALRWSGLQWDEGPDIGGPYGPYRQSERLPTYKEYVDLLVKEGKAYLCFATAEELEEMREVARKTGGRQGYDRRYRNLSQEEIDARIARGESYCVRLKVPLTGDCIFEDEIKGRITVPWGDVDDQVLMKADGFPTYHLANVVDDHLMKITHVIRGDEWLSSMPKHILLYQAFGWEAPVFMHMPLLLGTDGKKLSKRRNPTSIFFYRDSGYLPEAFLNFLSLMGYSMPNDLEVYSLETLIKGFDEKRIGKSGAVFDVNKLDWINQQYLMHNIPPGDLWARIRDWGFKDSFLEKLVPLLHTRIKTFGDFMELSYFLFVNHLPWTHELFEVKGTPSMQVIEILQGMIWRMEANDNWSGVGFEEASRYTAEVFGVHHKKVVIPLLFVSIQGKRQGLPLFDSVSLLGKDRTRARLLAAIQFLGGISNKRQVSLKKEWDSGKVATPATEKQDEQK